MSGTFGTLQLTSLSLANKVVADADARTCDDNFGGVIAEVLGLSRAVPASREESLSGDRILPKLGV